ncbi:hypothetical protein P1J78_20430 [Psychromarinibacter sp. C21-152]|uniref:Flp pilus assembly protein, pilin Flp n=1 Tax=Psychromarinibacter sediminicola TaxID=3033385 RepID=A0AAE3NY69_9RHOB|nr:hypothetical protein [Psychromarinibacter sediminicola]MDF0603120.1 hypothetical protein [Psychromarinibacter sediminicola]
MLLIKSLDTRFGRFLRREDGAITVDWVVITAGVVGLCISVFAWVGNDTHDYGERVGKHMSTEGVKTAY